MNIFDAVVKIGDRFYEEEGYSVIINWRHAGARGLGLTFRVHGSIFMHESEELEAA